MNDTIYKTNRGQSFLFVFLTIPNWGNQISLHFHGGPLIKGQVFFGGGLSSYKIVFAGRLSESETLFNGGLSGY